MVDTIDSAFETARDHINFAKEALDEFVAAGDRFMRENGSMVQEPDDEGDVVHKFRLSADLPKVLRRKATETLLNTKHAFDQATHAAKTLTRNGRIKESHFPWADTRQDLPGKLEKNFIDCRLWPAFEHVQPYWVEGDPEGAVSRMRDLAALANKKHTVGITLDVSLDQNVLFDKRHSNQTIRKVQIFEPDWDPVKREAKVLLHSPGARMEIRVHTTFALILRKGETVNAIWGLQCFTDTAQVFTEELATICRSIG